MAAGAPLGPCPVGAARRLSVTDPLVFFYGQLSPGDNPKLFNVVVDNLAATVEQRFASDSAGAFPSSHR